MSTDTLTLSSVDASDTDNYDVVVFIVLGEGGGCPYDLNNDGLLSFFDVSAYLSGYNAGCP